MFRKNLVLPVLAFVAVAGMALAADAPPVAVGPIGQEVATLFTAEKGLPSNNVFLVLLGKDGLPYASTDKGLARFKDDKWAPMMSPSPDNRMVHQICILQIDRLYVDASNAANHQPVLFPSRSLANEEFNDLVIRGEDYYLATARGLHFEGPGKPYKDLISNTSVHQLAVGPDGKIVAAADSGLFQENASGVFEPLMIKDDGGRQWAAADVLATVFDSQGRLWFATKAGVGCKNPDAWRFYTAAEGLPYNDFTCMAAGGDGAVWFGTHKGAIRYDGKEWTYREGLAWLPNDDVRAIAVDKQGTAWLATPGGIARIERKPMKLSEKAAFYEEEIEKYIKRTEYGLVAEVALRSVGDKSNIIRYDTDNDGLWTSMYGAGECFAYGATKDPKFQARAKQAFEALRFLQKVTQDCEHSPPKGFLARTIRSTEEADPNEGRVEMDRWHRAKRDMQWKVYEPRWPKSADGKWYWKSDTSSDELDGHYFFYPAYYDLVAETEEEKERVREVVRDLTDHLIEHDYALVDFDGQPTRWGIYSPKYLNKDTTWWYERGLKSLSMLSYLAVAEHMTGDAKYSDAIRDLVEHHGYLNNAMLSKVQSGFGSGNQSDDEMAVMCYYNLVKYAKDLLVRNQILYSFYWRWTLEAPEMNPFFNFAYAAVALDARFNDAWGSHKIDPWEGWLDDSIRTLTGIPLDRIGWPHQNSHRLDILHLPRQQASEPQDLYKKGRGLRNNGKVLPVEERYFGHWNTDPYILDYKGNGRMLASGTVFLLPYYMGLYHGFIQD